MLKRAGVGFGSGLFNVRERITVCLSSRHMFCLVVILNCAVSCESMEQSTLQEKGTPHLLEKCWGRIKREVSAKLNHVHHLLSRLGCLAIWLQF